MATIKTGTTGEGREPLQPPEMPSVSDRVFGHGLHLFTTRLVLGAILIVMFSLFAGYGLFRLEIDRLSSSSPAGKADGIVVLTGDKARISKGVELFESGAAKRLLISGVYKSTTKRALLGAVGYRSARADCCFDLGYLADDTKGNAIETKRWMEENGFQSLIVVTSNYHMPRSLLELKSMMPDVKFSHFSVVSVDNSSKSALRANYLRRTVREYGKYLAAHASILWRRMTAGKPL